VALTLGIDLRPIEVSICSFTGTKRRFEYVGSLNGASVIDDYAHHPTEIRATLTAAKGLGCKRVICIFQPHTYSRTAALFDQFVEALQFADLVILAEIYAAREINVYNLSSRDLAGKIPNARYFDSFEKIAAHMKKEAAENDLIFTMGAGDISRLGPMLTEN
jgi:UDP-N-acetylmuramate--alanine ligase